MEQDYYHSANYPGSRKMVAKERSSKMNTYNGEDSVTESHDINSYKKSYERIMQG